MTTTRVFQNGNSQALRIPQEMRTDKNELFICKVGEVFVAFPTDDPWASTKQVLGSFPSDFMSERNQPSWNSVSEREAL